MLSLINSYRSIILIIGVGFLSVLLGLFYVGARLNHDIGELKTQTLELYQHPFQVNASAREARQAVTSIRNELLYAIADKRLHPDLASNIRKHDAALDTSLQTIEARFLGDMSKVREARALIVQWRRERASLVALLEKGRRAEAEELMLATTGPLYEALLPRIDYVVDFSSDKARYFAEQAQLQAEESRAKFRMLLAAFGLYALFIGGTSTTIILRSLRQRDLQIDSEQERLRLLSENVKGFSFILLDPQGHVASWNEGAKRLHGYEAEEIIGKPVDGFFHPDEARAGKPAKMIGKALTHGIQEDVGWRVRKDGSRFYADDIISPLRDHGDRLLGFVKITRDITERHQLEERFRAMFESAPIPLLMVNEEGNIMLANARVKKDFGYGRKELIGKPVEILIPERFRGGHFGQMRSYLGDGQPPRADFRRELLALAKDGHEFPVEIGLGAFKLGDQHLVLASINNITERKAMEEQIRQLAFYDTLTGLPNRRLLSDRLAQAMAASKRSGCYGALMFLDLDNFKPLNDTHGHAVGDLLLMEVANRLKGCVRETDTVARFGGDEFVVVLNELDLDRAESASQAGIIAEKILAALSEPYLLAVRHEGGGETTIEHHCSASIGATLFVSNESGQEDILKRADAAMYQAKESGRSQIRFYQGRA